MRRFVVPLLVFAVLAALLVAGLAVAYRANQLDATERDPQPTPTASESTGSTGSTEGADDVTTPPDPALATYYSQELSWESCEGQYECSTLEVPLDYADPTGETIELAVLRMPAAGGDAERVGSLVVNPGGPGAPGTDFAAAAPRVFRKALLDAFDVVGFDPRGTGESAPVDCLSDADLDAYLAADPDPDTAAEERASTEWTERLGQGCVERSGSLADHVTTIEAARDMDVLRAALGEAEMRYYGASYGTKLGATYADLFPSRVGRLVLDGAIDVAMTSRDASLGQAEGFQRALEAYVADCVEVGDCYLGDSVDDGLQRIADFLVEVDQQPLGTGTDRELTEGLALLGIITPLYNRDYWFLLDDALKKGLGGDGSGLLEMADLYASRNPDGTFADNSSEAIFAIDCLDDPWALPADEIEAQVADFEEVSPTLGRTFAWMLVGCGGIEAKSTEPPRDIRAAGAAPIVVIGTTRDPATPYEWAQALAAQLESGVLVSRDGDGHTAYNSGNECVATVVEEYLVDGKVPEDGLSC